MRSARCVCRPVSEVLRAPRCAASAWNTTAFGTIRVLWPALAARQPKSMSLPKMGIRSSNPPSSSNTERRTSIPAVLTASTWRTSSCCPWSYSPSSSPVSRRPVPEIVTPTSRSRLSEGHSRSFGPRMSASGSSEAASRSAASAPGSGFASSCRIQTHSQAAWPSSPRRTAWGKPVLSFSWTTASAPRASASSRALSSLLPVSTATTWSGDTDCAASPSSTAGSQRAPSWLTSTAVTPRGAPGSRPATSGARCSPTADHPTGCPHSGLTAA